MEQVIINYHKRGWEITYSYHDSDVMVIFQEPAKMEQGAWLPRTFFTLNGVTKSDIMLIDGLKRHINGTRLRTRY